VTFLVVWGMREREMERAKSGESVGLPYWPALDGLRGLAVAGVLLFHAGFGWAKGGFLGVSAFFTLSGFLITTLLLTEWRDTGAISLRRFWARRVRRLMPVALLALAGIVAFGALVADADQTRALRFDVLAALGDVANWRFIFSGQSYAGLFTAPSPVLHFWSLAIEEQFYLCFPLLALLALRARGRRALAITLVVLAMGSIMVGRFLFDHGASDDRLYYGTDTRAFELLSGALLAVVLSGSGAVARRARGAVVQVAGALALVAMVGLWAAVDQSDAFLYRGGLLVHALLASVVIAAAVAPGGPVRALLRREPLRRLGLVSYGVYVYHWPLFLWLDADRTGLTRLPLFVLRVAVTVALAVCSYRLLERPIRSGRRLTGYRPWAVAPAAALSVCVALVAVTAHPPPPTIVYSAVYSRPPEPPPPQAQPVTPTPAASTSATLTRPVRLMIIGDSVAETVGRGLERWGARTGEAVVRNSGVGWCAIGRGGVAYLFGSRPREQTACSRWSRWGFEEIRPDVVVVLSTVWETYPRELPQWGDAHRIGEPTYDRWLISEYAALTQYVSSFGARVIWLTAPCTQSRPEVAVALDRLNVMINWLPYITAPGELEVVDLHDHVCPGGEFAADLGGVQGARPDGLHFSDPGSDWLATWLGPRLVGAFDAPVVS
jgi:peptidoglycan/LPS O-acetylase OafA/YrhL